MISTCQIWEVGCLRQNLLEMPLNKHCISRPVYWQRDSTSQLSGIPRASRKRGPIVISNSALCARLSGGMLAQPGIGMCMKFYVIGTLTYQGHSAKLSEWLCRQKEPPNKIFIFWIFHQKLLLKTVCVKNWFLTKNLIREFLLGVPTGHLSATIVHHEKRNNWLFAKVANKNIITFTVNFSKSRSLAKVRDKWPIITDKKALMAYSDILALCPWTWHCPSSISTISSSDFSLYCDTKNLSHVSVIILHQILHG